MPAYDDPLAAASWSWQDASMIRSLLIAGLLASGAAACTTDKPYGPASSPSAQGYLVQPIESNRFRVSYTALSSDDARRYALRRAAEVTFENGGQWFRVVRSTTDTEHNFLQQSCWILSSGLFLLLFLTLQFALLLSLVLQGLLFGVNLMAGRWRRRCWRACPPADDVHATRFPPCCLSSLNSTKHLTSSRNLS